MKALLQEAFLILVITQCILCLPPNPSSTTAATTKKTPNESSDYQYEDYEDDLDQHDEVLFSENKPCPRDCICANSLDNRIARCSRLEVGTQKFGDDITGLVVENVDPRHPLILTDMMFRKLGLHQITNVKITNSTIAAISPTAFKGLHELYSANLTANKIEIFDFNIFAYNEKLTLVDLSDNPLVLTKSKQVNQPLLNSTSIQELEIARCGIREMPKKALSKLPNLMYINLSGNKLMNIDSSLFVDLSSLEEVDLSNNFLESIPGDLFLKNLEITTLSLKGNPISSVIDVNANELLTLDLSLANIKTVGPSMFNGMSVLSNLNLSGNIINIIHNQAFHNITGLNYLDLSNNNLDFISDQLIKENTELDTFKISRNPNLRYLPEEGFACSAEYFDIFLFDASGCSIELIYNNTFKTMPALSQLLLSHNKIRTVGSAFKNLMQLADIDLSYNMIGSLDKYTFGSNKELGKLNLAGNPLTSISPELFVNNPILAWLDISSCLLTTLWASQVPLTGVMNNIHFINASNNMIEKINYKELELINKLFTFDIAQNPLRCDKDFETLMTWLGNHNTSPADREMFSEKLSTEKVTSKREKWESFARSICEVKIIPEIPNHIKDEKDNSKSKIENMVDDYDIDDDGDDDDDEDDDLDLDDDDNSNIDEELEEDTYDASFVKKKGSQAKEESTTAKYTGELLYDYSKIYEKIDHNKIDIPIVHNIIGETKKTEEIFDDLENEKEIEKEMEEELMASYERESSYREYVLPIKIAALALGAMLMTFALVYMMRNCSRVARDHNRVKCAIISINPGNGRVKKDCGLVYQQLSEDLTGPKTPIISRQLFGGKSYQSSPFHHSNITPEQV